MKRQVLGIFDEYTSRENGKQVARAMRENALTDSWNGAIPPLGSRLSIGQTIEEQLALDPAKAETVRVPSSVRTHAGSAK